jgi:hypothetical protein
MRHKMCALLRTATTPSFLVALQQVSKLFSTMRKLKHAMVHPKVLSLHCDLHNNLSAKISNMKKFLLVVAVLFGLLPASIAKAHDPIILTSDQRTPSDGPLLLDGTISFALYGSLDARGETRGFRVDFNAGDPLYISILIPDLAPENMLDNASLPFLNVEDPSGA